MVPGTDGPQYRDCIIDEVCITRDYNSAPYNFGTAPVYSLMVTPPVMDPTHQDLTFTLTSPFQARHLYL